MKRSSFNPKKLNQELWELRALAESINKRAMTILLELQKVSRQVNGEPQAWVDFEKGRGIP